MRGLILTLLLLVFVASVYADEPQQVIDVQHDARRGVTCWIIPGTGISCLPDSQLRQPTQVPGRAQDRANPASAPTPRQHDERVQL